MWRRRMRNYERLFSKFRAAFKQIVGMPDYPRYLEHVNRHHPECRVLTEREYYDQYIAARYAGGGSRCC